MVTLAPSQSYFLHLCVSINRDTPREIILLTPIEPKQCWESTDRRTKSGCRKEQEPDPGSPLKSQSQFFKLPIRTTGRIKYEQQWLFWLQPMQSPPRFLSLHIRMVDWGSSALAAGAQRAGRAKRKAAMNCFMLSVVGHDYVRREGIACVENASQNSIARGSQDAFIDFPHGCNYRERVALDPDDVSPDAFVCLIMIAGTSRSHAVPEYTKWKAADLGKPPIFFSRPDLELM